MTATVLVQLEGSDAPLPLKDLAWEHVAPCGCTSGVMVAETADEDAAFREFMPNAEARRRDIAEGSIFRLAPRGTVIDRLKVECGHDPKWGRQRVPIPDGYRWAETWDSRRSHLVPVDPAEPKNFRDVRAKPVHAGPRDYESYWREAWTTEVPTCRSCERWARKRAAS